MRLVFKLLIINKIIVHQAFIKVSSKLRNDEQLLLKKEKEMSLMKG